MSEAYLAHFGIKGMKWGKRKAKVTDGLPPSTDYENKIFIKKQSRDSGTKSLTNKQLREAIDRMNLENQYSSLNAKTSAKTRGVNAVKGVIAVGGALSSLYALSTSPMAKEIKKQVQARMK